MADFLKSISVVYPPNNHIIFEEWFEAVYKGCDTDRELLPIFPTSYWVNNDYGNNQTARKEVQDFVDSLDTSKKYFIICQYDDGCMLDWKGKDVLEFNMSKKVGIELPLLCQPHPYSFDSKKKYLASFIGSKTHKVREMANGLKGISEMYISFENHQIEDYCKIIHESVFTLCYRGYGMNSFRIAEAMQFGSIPVYISDEFIIPFGLDFNDFGILLNSEDHQYLHEKLISIKADEIIRKQEACKKVYEDYYTYSGSYNKIISTLATEYHSRKNATKI